MACRIDTATFAQMAEEERPPGSTFPIVVTEDPKAGLTTEILAGDVVLHKKVIQGLVDEAEQARPILRNLLRWASEELARLRE